MLLYNFSQDLPYIELCDNIIEKCLLRRTTRREALMKKRHCLFFKYLAAEFVLHPMFPFNK